MLESVQPYSTALLCLIILVLVVCIQSFSSTFVNLIKGASTPGKEVEGNHEDTHWRMYRAHQNSVENFSLFAATVLVGILVGASATLINILAIVHLVARLAHWIIFVRGIGAVAPGPRTICFVVGFMANIFMALVVMFAAL